MSAFIDSESESEFRVPALESGDQGKRGWHQLFQQEAMGTDKRCAEQMGHLVHEGAGFWGSWVTFFQSIFPHIVTSLC